MLGPVIDFVKIKGTWREIADAARTTVNKEPGTGEPSSDWKRRILIAEHSPIRKLKLSWKWKDLMYWVSTHFVRHSKFAEHFISTQRDDRTGEDRNNKPQGALVSHEVDTNAQEIINISRKRLCNQAHQETREVWKLFLESIKDKEPELYSVCVPECIYRGFCPEMKSCNYHKSAKYKERLLEYRKGINDE